MKQLIYFLGFFFFSLQVQAQQKDKTDLVVKTNGAELRGTVKEMQDDVIRFVYKGESLVYTIKKEEIAKIIFSSGRTEVFSKPAADPAPVQPMLPVQDHHNRIGILPFSFVMDGQPSNRELGQKVQNECFSMLSSHAGPYTVADINTSNALLLKAGVSPENIAGYTMDELCNILSVEYIVSGAIIMNRTSQTNYSSGSENTDYKNKNNSKSSSYTYGSSYSTSTQNFATTLTLNIYTDKGEAIYNKDRRSFWSSQDAYKSTLEYLLKCSPLYKK